MDYNVPIGGVRSRKEGIRADDSNASDACS